jgi:mannosyltransferase
VIAWISSQASPAWALRYLAVCVPPLLLLSTLGLARAGRLGLAGVAVVAVMWATDFPPEDKSNVRDVATAIAPGLEPGDVVVSAQPEQIPVLAYYLPEGLRFATLWGPVDDVGVTDWRDGVERLERTSPERGLDPLLDRVQPGGRLVIVEPIVYERGRWSAPWTSLVRRRSLAWIAHAGEDERFTAVAVEPRSEEPRRFNPVRATVFVRRGMR